MFIFLTRKVSIPNASQLNCISWMRTGGYIVVGGSGGILKVIKLSQDQESQSSSTPPNFAVTQNLEGHRGSVERAIWNESYQKLTSCDSNGLIIVWLVQKENWFEEMINNRNKSRVVDMAWNPFGTKIAIAYEDGVVVSGGVDGNGLWTKTIEPDICAVCWSSDSSLLIFGLKGGKILTYNSNGDFLHKVHTPEVDDLGIQSSSDQDGGKELIIVSIQWYANLTVEISANMQRSNKLEATRIRYEYQISENRPRLFVAYKHGVIQLMRNDNDTFPLVVQVAEFTITKAEWSPSGSYIALCGIESTQGIGRNTVHIMSVYGEHLRKLYLPGENITDLSWESTGNRLCFTVDSHIYFANIRYTYKWAYCGHTVVYGYEPNDGLRQCVAFFETKLEECYLKYVKNLIGISAYGNYCVIATKTDEQVNEYHLQICNGIATPIDSKTSDIEPKFMAMNHLVVLVASEEAFFIWRYTVHEEKQKEPPTIEGTPLDLIYFGEDIKYNDESKTDANRKVLRDLFCAVAVSNNFFLICRESGIVHRYGLPNITLGTTFLLGLRPERIDLNCSGTKLAVLYSQGIKLFHLQENDVVPMNFDRKDVWDFRWDSENEDAIAIAEKNKIYILKDLKSDEPIINSGYICSFENLMMRTIDLDQIMRHPEAPNKTSIIEIEDKSLRDAKKMLEKANIQEATEFIEKNGHPKLWALLAEVALKRVDTATAEHAFVMLKDYAGIQLIKRLNSIQHAAMKTAEIAVFYGRLDEAEAIYIEHDRQDLAVAMRSKFNDWFHIAEEASRTQGLYGDDQLHRKAWQEIGAYYLERQCWGKAMSYFDKAESYEHLVRCALMTEDYEKLEAIVKQLRDGHPLLEEIGNLFGGAGLCEQAVNCYLRCNKPNSALDICVQLNQWEKAVQLSKDYNLKNIDFLLKKYTNQLKDHISDSSEKTLAVVQLYRRSGKYVEAAKIVSEIANEERKRRSQPLRLKKLYVLSALLIEQYHKQCRKKIAHNDEEKTKAKIALKGLLEEDTCLSVTDSILIDNAWRGAEAYHFYMLAQRQFYQRRLDAALKTAVRLTDYEDYIDPLEIYSILALISCSARQFSICSCAFMKLESLSTLSEREQKSYIKLAISIFTKHPPEDTDQNKVECPYCKEQIQNYYSNCPLCNKKFPVCIVTGKPLLEYQFWSCPSCKHRACESEISAAKYCPLCHFNLLGEQS